MPRKANTKTVKNSIRIIIATIAFAASAVGQTPSPSPSATPIPPGAEIFGKVPASDSDRIADAQTFMALPSTSATDAANAGTMAEELVLNSATVANWNTLTNWTPSGSSTPVSYAQIASILIGSKGFAYTGTTLPVASSAYGKAITTSMQVQGTNAKSVAFMRALLPSLNAADLPPPVGFENDAWSGYQGILTNYAVTVLAAANDSKGTGDYAGALTYLADPVLPNTNQWTNMIGATANVKSLSRASDALSWAKLYYLVVQFGNSADGINAVTMALKSADLNLGRANAFTASQNDPTATNTDAKGFVFVNTSYTNALSGIALPAPYASGLPHPEYAPLVDAVIRGNTASALTQGMGAFLAANDNSNLNAAVGEIARALRDHDLNLVRANGFIAAQKAGQTYPLGELESALPAPSPTASPTTH
jgi:hypothetical protein